MTSENPLDTDTFGSVLGSERRVRITMQTETMTYDVLIRRTTPCGVENGLGPYFFEASRNGCDI